MKKIPKIIITAAVISTMSVPTLATEIPLESAPLNASIQSIEITENFGGGYAGGFLLLGYSVG